MISRHYRVRGRVQGVGFRYFVVDEATRLGVVGWVRNCPDGSVEVEATAPMLSLASLREALARGPRGARVDGVEELEIEAPAATAGRFIIMR